MNVKEILLAREAELLKACDQLEQQYAWAHQHEHKDLCEAYTEGSRMLFTKLREVQSLIRALKED